MYRNINDFVREWTYESASTLTLFSNITDASLLQKDHDDIRSIGRLAWHITITLSEMMNKAGLHVSGPHEDEDVPPSVRIIQETYKTSAESILSEVQQHWTHESLSEEVNMYGEMWTKATILSVLIRHQAHHRGQLTVLMRQAGLKVPGIYGPSKEEWQAMNMPPME